MGYGSGMGATSHNDQIDVTATTSRPNSPVPSDEGCCASDPSSPASQVSSARMSINEMEPPSSPFRSAACSPRSDNSPGGSPMSQDGPGVSAPALDEYEYLDSVSLRMRTPHASVSRHIAMDNWIEQELLRERDEAMARALKAESALSLCRRDRNARSLKASAERKALEAQNSTLRQANKELERSFRVALYDANKCCIGRVRALSWPSD